MSISNSYTMGVGRVLHWIACLLGTAMVVLFGVFAVADPPPLSVLLMPEMWALILIALGFLLIWRNDVVGGVMSVTATAMFYLLNYSEAGNFPGGWVFPLCFVPGLLAIVAGVMRIRFVGR